MCSWMPSLSLCLVSSQTHTPTITITRNVCSTFPVFVIPRPLYHVQKSPQAFLPILLQSYETKSRVESLLHHCPTIDPTSPHSPPKSLAQQLCKHSFHKFLQRNIFSSFLIPCNRWPSFAAILKIDLVCCEGM